LAAGPLDVAVGSVAPSPIALEGTNPLVIDGGSGDDTISVTADSVANLSVNNDGAMTQPGNANQFTGILIRGHAGNDTISAVGVPLPVVIKGGPGADSLTGSAAPSALIGGGGNDTLVGGSDANLLIGAGLSFLNHANGNDSLVGGASGSDNYADFIRRTDAALLLSNDGQPHGGTTIDTNVQNILAGTGADTITSTISGSFLSAGIGADSLTSGGAGTTLQAGPIGASGDTVTASGGTNALLLANSHADTYSGTGATDVLALDAALDVMG
jgi:Ca2+-binding RTX toxin-like protein